MSTRAQWITNKPSEDKVNRALREGLIRFNLERNAGYRTYGAPSLQKHQGGRLAEIIFGEGYLRIEVPEDIDLKAALKRGWDVGGYHIRSTRHYSGGLLLRDKDPHGVYALVNTCDAPQAVYIVGWITKAEVVKQVELTPMRDDPSRLVYDVPQKLLHPFPSIGGRVMVHDCMSMQLAA